MFTSSEFLSNKLLSLHTGGSGYDYGLERLLSSTQAVSDGKLDISSTSLSAVMSLDELKSVSPINMKSPLRQSSRLSSPMKNQHPSTAAAAAASGTAKAPCKRKEIVGDIVFQDSYNSDFKRREQIATVSPEQDCVKSAGGYKYLKLDFFKKMAEDTLSHPERRKDLLRDKEFQAVLDSQQEALNADINLKDIVYSELKRDSFPGHFVVDIVTLAFSEMSLNSHFASSVRLAKYQTARDIENSMSKLLKSEEERRVKLDAFADKILLTRKRYVCISIRIYV